MTPEEVIAYLKGKTIEDGTIGYNEVVIVCTDKSYVKFTAEGFEGTCLNMIFGLLVTGVTKVDGK